MTLQHSKILTSYPQKDGETQPRVDRFIEDGQLKTNPPGLKNLEECFQDSMKRHGENTDIIGYRPVLDSEGNVGPYKWLSFRQFYTRYHNFGDGLLKLGHKKGDRIGIFSKNRIEWLLTDYGCLSIDTCAIPLYDTLGIESVEHIVVESDLSTIVCTPDRAEYVLQIIPETNSVIKRLVIMDEISDELRTKCNDNNVQVISFTETEKLGAENPSGYTTDANLDSLVTICYTSGTTGMPKGVMLNQTNFLSAIESLDFFIKNKEIIDINETDSYISLLPLAHILERFLVHMLMFRGCKIGFFRGDMLKVMDDIATLQPSIFVGVPRLFTRIKDRVTGEIEKKGGVTSYLYNYAYSSKLSRVGSGVVTHWLWDYLIFSKIKAKLGGRIKLIISGSAPISGETLDFLRICFSCSVQEGYGSTETTGAVSLTTALDHDSGTVGVPFPNAMIKLVDVPEMGYLSTDKPYPRGEVCAKGPGIFQGYYKQPEKTAESLDADGWCYTGDIGMYDDLGRLRIIDRKKNLFKLSQGEYVAPERIENVYTDNQIVTQAFVYGHSLKSYLVGIIVPEPDLLVKFLKSTKVDFDESLPFAEICKNNEVRKAVVKNLNQWGRSRDLKGFENVNNVYLEPNPFEIPTILSPTLKLKRIEAKAHYITIIDSLYAETGDI
ncbi:hypothetical protein BB558_002014 [Smittium angustum]|uniref:AMP-dependent synthetase/ligase domain-containing protein n=1 Tax=Smittium angustum TaxID=133377 RepID=A0A2U1JA21_SMIAN|nr:hypothetical protein BB558_002014 [Smittium angustum]